MFRDAKAEANAAEAGWFAGVSQRCASRRPSSPPQHITTMSADKDLVELATSTTEDLYALLGIAADAPEAAIKKAYRKASILYHPDKNPDNNDAADRFIYLGWARDILLSPELKGEYDRARARRREKALQDELLDGRRRKMKEDLERREREGREWMSGLKRKRQEEMSEAEKREEAIRRLAEDGKRRRKEAQERMEKRRKQEDEASFIDAEEAAVPVHLPRPGDSAEIDRTVKARFQREGETLTWDKDTIARLFSKYGKIDSVILGRDKKIRLSGEKHRKLVAIVFVIYTRIDHAHAAVLDAKADVPLLESVAWANGEPDLSSSTIPPLSSSSSTTTRTRTSSTTKSPTKPPTKPLFSTAPSTPFCTPLSTPNKTVQASFGPGLGGGGVKGGFGSATTPLGTPKFSFSPKTPSLEEVTMMRLKQAEKKRLEQQIRRREAATEKDAGQSAA